jgi:hypothetical protein
MARPITVKAFAKINLDLQVIGIRPDGYHELRTTFQSIALSDTLTFRKTRGPFRIECDDPAFPVDRTNLIWKAAERVLRLARRRDVPSGVTVHVEKNIPMQSAGRRQQCGGDAARALRCGASAPARTSCTTPRHGWAPTSYFEGARRWISSRDLFPLDDIEPSSGDCRPNWRYERGVRLVGCGEQGAGKAQGGRVGKGSRRRSPNDLEAAVAKRHPIVAVRPR